MSTAALLLCKNEADIIEPIVRHTAANVDELIISDGDSTDGTTEILRRLRLELPMRLSRETDPAWYQSKKMALLARVARERGHTWVVPMDADEVWIAGDGRRVADFLAGVSPDVKTVRAVIYNHFPTSLDLMPTEKFPGLEHVSEPNPLKRIGWRARAHQPVHFGKVAARLLPGLVIADGNHAATSQHLGTEIGGLEIRHFAWRTPERYAAKMANGYRALALTNLPYDIGKHWRDHGDPDADPGYQERLEAHFREWFVRDDPEHDDEMEFNPAPLRGQV